MKFLIFTFFFCFYSLIACESQQDIMKFIESCKKGSLEISNYVEKGLKSFEQQDFISSLSLFNLVLDLNYQDASMTDIGTSLWGSLLCAAILDDEKLFEQRFNQAYDFFIKLHDSEISTNRSISNRNITLASNSDWKSRLNNEKRPDPEVKFANPSEKITIGECIDRVKGVAMALKFGIAFVKKGHYAFVLNAFVDTLQEKCTNCCRSGAFWTACVSPILLTLNKWKILGIPDDPAWD